MTEPCDLSAVEARRRILARSLSPVELLQSCVARIERTNRVVNAIVAIDVETARKRAEAIEQALRRGEEIGLLAGLPIGVRTYRPPRGSGPQADRYYSRTMFPSRTNKASPMSAKPAA
jgi:amidase